MPACDRNASPKTTRHVTLSPGRDGGRRTKQTRTPVDAAAGDGGRDRRRRPSPDGRGEPAAAASLRRRDEDRRAPCGNDRHCQRAGRGRRCTWCGPLRSASLRNRRRRRCITDAYVRFHPMRGTFSLSAWVTTRMRADGPRCPAPCGSFWARSLPCPRGPGAARQSQSYWLMRAKQCPRQVLSAESAALDRSRARALYLHSAVCEAACGTDRTQGA